MATYPRFFICPDRMETLLIQKGIDKGLIKFDENNINYKIQNFVRDWKNPEEKVRAEAYLMLVFNYGYNPENIGFEISCKQGGGSKYADIVVFKENSNKKEGFLVVEVKAADSKEKPDEVRKQARSYAKSEEIKFLIATRFNVSMLFL
jgi:type I restriction enzyme M protein